MLLQVYFAGNNAVGIFEVVLSTVSLSGTTGTFTLQKLGVASAASNYNGERVVVHFRANHYARESTSNYITERVHYSG